ncbi:MAG: hypothetical protein QOC95_1520 [Thermoleophilaceae bacterium]|nr:hypothetical protein [Thermoleophilaceae bacterium]
MQAQASAGHDVSYVFSGRHYPRLERPRLKRWRHGGVRMYELIGSPNDSHWERGTRRPLVDLDEPAGEAAFASALRESQPEIVHIQELARLPSSVIEQAKAFGVPVLMTLHDYKTVCASVRLLDADGRRCTRTEVGEDCARNCAGAPEGRAHLVEWTMDYELSRARSAVPFGRSVDVSRLAPAVGAVKALARGGPPAAPSAVASAAASPAQYQRRRDVNLGRLSQCDRLVAPSRRVAEIYTELGVPADRLTVQRLTLPHLERLAPQAGRPPNTPLTFVTLGSCASRPKGSDVVVDAVKTLERQGRGGHYRLVVLGHVEEGARRELGGVASVELAGPYSPRDLDRLLDAADVGVMPSVWEEAHGFVGIEMLAKGLPMIANALGGMTEYVREGQTGWLNHDATGAGIARLMAAAIDDPEGVERMRRSVRERRDEVVRPMQDHLAEVEALYAELTSAARASQAAAIPSPADLRAGS